MNLTADQAVQLSRRIDAADSLYATLAARYARTRPEMERRTGLPVAGGAIGRDLRNLDDTMTWLDANATLVRDASAGLVRRAAQGPVELPDGVSSLVESWTGGVAEADDTLRKYEALGTAGGLSEAPAPAAGVPWTLVALASVALLGAIVWAAWE